MKSRQSIDPTAYVVRLRDGSNIAERMESVKQLGLVEQMEGYPDRCLLRDPSIPGDPKTTWQELRDHLGEAYEVEPAMVDDRGTPSYPTGTVTVRFEQAPSDDELSECERTWGMRVKERNQYIPSQVTFQEKPSDQYLPDLIESIEHTAKRVRAVWADTVSRYKR